MVTRRSDWTDCDLLPAGRTRRLLDGWVPAPSTLGTFLRAFTFGHVRQLDKLLGDTLTRAWKAGAGTGDGGLVIDVDSFVGEVCGRLKQGAAYGYTKGLGYHPILATRSDTCEVLHLRLRIGSANTRRGMLRFCDELIGSRRPRGRDRREGASRTTPAPDLTDIKATQPSRIGGSEAWASRWITITRPDGARIAGYAECATASSAAASDASA